MSKANSNPSPHEFDRWAKKIATKIRQARAAEEKGNATLLRESEWGTSAYYFFQYIVVLERENLFEELKQHLGVSRGPRPSRSGLVMRLVEHQGGQKRLLSPTRRSRLSDALELAREFKVEPRLILGFLSEIGGQRVFEGVRRDPTKLAPLRHYRRSARQKDVAAGSRKL